MTAAVDREVRQEVADVLVRYATGIDRRDWVLFRSCFTDDCEADYGEIGVWHGADEITEWMRATHEPCGHTMHSISNEVVVPSGTGVAARSYVDVIVMFADNQAGTRAAGYYDDELVLTDAGWKIASRRFTMVALQFFPEHRPGHQPLTRTDDIELIKQLKARYFRTMDTKDWAAMREVFTDDVVIDTTESGGGVVTGADEFLEFLRGAIGEAVTVHHGHMPEIEMTSETTATGVWAMADIVGWPDGTELRGYGHYRDVYEKVGDTWRIRSSTLTRLRMDFSAAETA